MQLDEALFVGIEVGQTVVVDDPDGAFTVTAFDANHCSGRRSSFSGYNCVCIVFCWLMGSVLIWFCGIIDLCLIVGCFISRMIGLYEFNLTLFVLNCG